MRPLRIGRYRQRVYLQALAAAESFSTFGQPIPSWSTVGQYWAEVLPLQGRELIAAKQVKAQAAVKVRMRYLGSGVQFSARDRIVLGDRLPGTVQLTNASASVSFSQSQSIPLLSSLIFPGDSSLGVYQVVAGSGSSYTINPVFGGGSNLAGTASAARFFGLFDVKNVEERNRAYEAIGYEIQPQVGPH